MAKQLVNLGSNPNDGSGDPLRTGGDKINDNFTEVYNLIGDGTDVFSGIVTNLTTPNNNLQLSGNSGDVDIQLNSTIDITNGYFSGGVGIGTTINTASLFNIKGAGVNNRLRVENTNGGDGSFYVDDDNSVRVISTTTGASLIVETQNTERFRVLGAGNVGFNSTVPDTTVSIQSAGANGLELAKDSSSQASSSKVFFTTNAGSNSILATSGALQFMSGATAGSVVGTEIFRADSTGVGIKTSSVSAPLHVVGNAIITDNLNYRTYTGIVTTTATGSFQVPTGNTSERPSSPKNGYIRFNSQLGRFEGYKESEGTWQQIGGAGATGGGTDEVFVLNSMTVTTDFELPDGKSASSVGPITINDGVTVTVGDGESWVVL